MRTPTPSRGSWIRSSRGVQLSTMRMFRDQGWQILLIYEAGPEPPQTGPRVLVFEWDEGMAQLHPYPSDWRELSDTQLVALRAMAVQGPPA